MENKIVLCYSGGLDSMIAWHYLGKPTSVYFACSKYSPVEIASIRKTNTDCLIINDINLMRFEQGENAYIPHRNLMFAALASNFGNEVVIAGVRDDRVPDKNPEAFRMMSETLSKISKKNVTVSSPFWTMTKAQIVGWFLHTVADAVELIHKSCSCYSGNSTACNSCPSCFRKNTALFVNGILIPFYNDRLVEQYKIRIDSQCYYDPERERHMRRYIEWIERNK